MATQKIPIYIPTFISNAGYAPSRVLPHIYFYNGNIECETYYIMDGNNQGYAQTAFPYFDNYNVVTGSFPTGDSLSLLFNNENAAYGIEPSGSLYSTYWEKYISFLYNPKTRVLNCQGIIPFADYVKMALNDVVNFRGNYWHLRAINDYSLKTGECNIQLMGPIISDTFNQYVEPPPPPGPPNSASINWSFTENGQDGSFRIYDNGSNKVTATSTSTGNLLITQSHNANIELNAVGYPSSGSVTMSIQVNGDATITSTAYTNTTVTASFIPIGGGNYTVTGSITWNTICCAPTISTASLNGANIDIYFTTGSGCQSCTSTTVQASVDGTNWTNFTAGCGTPRSITAPTASTYYRMYETCGAVTSSLSNTYYFVSGSGGGAAYLDWTFSITGGPTATMDIWINSAVAESRNYTSSGVRSVNVGDVIYVEINMSGCSGGSNKANAYTSGIIADAACGTGATGLVSYSYTVQPGDVGTHLTLNSFASCDSGCL